MFFCQFYAFKSMQFLSFCDLIIVLRTTFVKTLRIQFSNVISMLKNGTNFIF